jgi:hypothetical protein
MLRASSGQWRSPWVGRQIDPQPALEAMLGLGAAEILEEFAGPAQRDGNFIHGKTVTGPSRGG